LQVGCHYNDGNFGLRISDLGLRISNVRALEIRNPQSEIGRPGGA